MNFDIFLDFISRVNQRIEKLFPDVDDRLRVMSQTVKLSEEVGELSEQILKRSGGQLHHKGLSDKEDIADEIADVMITAGTLAGFLDIDIKQALERKIKKIEKKWE